MGIRFISYGYLFMFTFHIRHDLIRFFMEKFTVYLLRKTHKKPVFYRIFDRVSAACFPRQIKTFSFPLAKYSFSIYNIYYDNIFSSRRMRLLRVRTEA